MRPATPSSIRRLVAARRRTREAIKIDSDRWPLQPGASIARDELLHAIESGTSAVRRAITVVISRARVYVTTASGWRLRVDQAEEITTITIITSPSGETARRRALREHARCHRLETPSVWLRWVLATISSTEPLWLTFVAFERQALGKAA